MKSLSAACSCKGFTLVELSIVLVILGLLVGGVLAGQSLIHAAELRAIGTEFTNYKTALGAFREKYNALPGDMNNAVRFWGAQAGGTADGIDATCAALTTAATSTATCNGNGDGSVGSENNTQPHEHFRFWQHLANAGLVEGTYTGVRGSGSTVHALLGTNVPRSKYPSGGWFMWGLGSDPFSSIFAQGINFRNTLYFGAETAAGLNYNELLTPEEAWNIDSKLDDGNPATGIVTPYQSGVCITPTEYLLSWKEPSCSMFFVSGY